MPRFSERGTTPTIVFAASCALHAASVAQCAWRFLPNPLLAPLLLPFAGVAAFSLALSLAGLLLGQRPVRIGLFLVRAIAVALIVSPVSEYNATKPALLFAYFLDAGFTLGLPESIVLSVLSSFFLAGFSQSGDRGHPAPLLETPLELVMQYVLYAVFFCGGSLVRWLDARRIRATSMAARLEDTIRRLTDANTGFQQYLRIAEENSKADERNRIIRELHDSLGYTFTTIIMLSESGLERARRLGVEILPGLFETIRDNAKTGLTDIRIALRLLKSRSDRTSDLNAVLRLAKAFEKATAVHVRCSLGNAPFWFGSSVDGIVFRIIQEGMVNAFRHGNATEIEISLSVSDGRFLVGVRDNGRGTAEVVEGIGIESMKEEVAATGGALRYTSSATGFSLTADVPLEPASAGAAGAAQGSAGIPEEPARALQEPAGSPPREAAGPAPLPAHDGGAEDAP